MRFVKMQACGNDYIYLDCIHTDTDYVLSRLDEASIARACHRHYGIGADGVVVLGAGYRMIMFNADGSRGTTCGNALRCIAHYLDLHYGALFPLTIGTDAGQVRVDKAEGLYAVDMGTARIVGTSRCGDTVYRIVDVGNLHAVAVGEGDVERLADAIRRGADLNVERYRVLSADSLVMQVNERGTGYTMGCGSGACAVAYDACNVGYCTFGIPVNVRMDGGEVWVRCRKDGIITLMGDAHVVYEGEYDF